MFKKIRYVILISCLSLTSVGRTNIDLRDHEYSFYSPNGEDGILIEIFKWIMPIQQFTVDIGAYDGITNSMTYMLRHQGWNALLFDKSFNIPVLDLHKEFITAENVNVLLEEYNVPHVFDLLAIDVGYNDFYIWQALAEKYKPSVVCIAYNSAFNPTDDQIVIHYPYFCGDDTLYFGASMLALSNLGKSKGYALVYAEEGGKHLFFVREDLLTKIDVKFAHTNDLNTLFFNVKTENLRDAKTASLKNRRYTSSDKILQPTPNDY